MRPRQRVVSFKGPNLAELPFSRLAARSRTQTFSRLTHEPNCLHLDGGYPVPATFARKGIVNLLRKEGRAPRRLYDKLRGMGFKENHVEFEGKRARVFKHPKVAASMIVLPERKSDEVVEPFDLQGVLVILRSRGLLPETNPVLT